MGGGGGFTCFVEGCYRDSKTHTELKYFNLPSEKDSRSLWIQLSGCSHKKLPSYARICSIHFEQNYHSWTCQQLGEQKSGCKCRPKGLPTLCLPAKAVNGDLLANVQTHLSLKKKSDGPE
jgi:THAP domain